jgi:hypothetical protein
MTFNIEGFSKNNFYFYIYAKIVPALELWNCIGRINTLREVDFLFWNDNPEDPHTFGIPRLALEPEEGLI